MLSARCVSKVYGNAPALKDVDLAVGPGQIMALLGPNGAGKTTLSNIVCGLLRADTGEVTISDVSVLNHPDLTRPRVGYAPQEVGLYPGRTVRGNLVHFARLAGFRSRALRSEIDRISGQLLLEDFLDKRVSNLSGGQKRRAHAAVAFIGHREVLVLDEPTAGADVHTRRAILETVRMAAQNGAAVCYCTHYLPEVEELGADLTIIKSGRVIASGSLESLRPKGEQQLVVVQCTGRVPAFEMLPEPQMHRIGENYELQFQCEDPLVVVEQVFRSFHSRAGSSLIAVEVRRQTLEERFLSLVDRIDAPCDLDNGNSAAPASELELEKEAFSID